MSLEIRSRANVRAQRSVSGPAPPHGNANIDSTVSTGAPAQAPPPPRWSQHVRSYYGDPCIRKPMMSPAAPPFQYGATYGYMPSHSAGLHLTTPTPRYPLPTRTAFFFPQETDRQATPYAPPPPTRLPHKADGVSRTRILPPSRTPGSLTLATDCVLTLLPVAGN